MYAVIKTGGKQQKVKPGDIIEVEHLFAEGETVTFQPLLVVDDDGHTHYGKEAKGALVTAKLLGEQKGDKVSIFKYKNKSGYARRAGHRQLLTLLEIAEVSLGDGPPKTADQKTAGQKTVGRKATAKKPAVRPAKAKETVGSEAPEPAEQAAEAPRD